MSNERIDFSELEDLQESWEERLTEEGIKEALGNWLFDNGNELIAELKRCYEEIDALRSITQDWVKIETFTDDGKDLSVDMEDSDGNCFSGYINRASE